MMKNTRLATAMHEAGHAVVQLANPPAPWIDSIEIDGLPDGLLGIVNTKAIWQPSMATFPTASAEHTEQLRQLAWKDIRFFMAGPIAELRWRRHSRAAIWFGGRGFAEQCLGSADLEPGNDLDRIRTRLLWAYPDDPHGAFHRAWEETEEMVAKHWRQISSIGRLLCERGRLSDIEVLDAWEASR